MAWRRQLEFVQPEGLEKRPLCSIASITIGAADCDTSGEEWFLVEADTAVPTPTPDAELVNWEEVETAVLRIPAVPLPPIPLEITGRRNRRRCPAAAAYSATSVKGLNWPCCRPMRCRSFLVATAQPGKPESGSRMGAGQQHCYLAHGRLQRRTAGAGPRPQHAGHLAHH